MQSDGNFGLPALKVRVWKWMPGTLHERIDTA